MRQFRLGHVSESGLCESLAESRVEGDSHESPSLQLLGLNDRELKLGHELSFIAARFIHKAKFAIGATDLITVGFNPFENNVICLLHSAEATVVNH